LIVSHSLLWFHHLVKKQPQIAARRLAVAGGEPAFPSGPPSWPCYDEEVAQTLNQALVDGSWGKYQSAHTEHLIDLLCEMFGVKHAYPVCSGTFATELALRMLHIGPGDEVLLAGYDFPGNFRAIEAVGACPVVIDVRRNGWCIDHEMFAAAASPHVKGVIVSHLHGHLAPMPAIMAEATQRGWKVVEDACQTPGAILSGKPAGSWGDVGTLSFGGSKLLTAGRGGAVLTSSPQLWQRAKIYCEQGNHAYPLSELQAAVLSPQLKKLSERNRQRLNAVEQLVSKYGELVGKGAVLEPVLPVPLPDMPAFYKLAWRVAYSPDESCSAVQNRRDAVAKALQAEGIAIDAGFRGFVGRGENRCRKVGALTSASDVAASTLIMHHPILLEADDILTRLAVTFAEIHFAFRETSA
jgi:perosamine synthetase